MHPALPIVLLLAFWLLLLLHHSAHADCEPATCGSLMLRYPFWLGVGGNNNPTSSCGHPAFEVVCIDNGGAASASLKGSSIHVLSIDYNTTSFVASHSKISGAGGVCQADFNMSISIALSPFSISRSNRALCFLYNCTTGGAEPGYVNATAGCSIPIYAYLGGAYDRDSPPAIATGGCTYTFIPVLGREADALTAANYSRLLRDGFQLEWEAAAIGDCAACSAGGGECRYDSAAAAFYCLCPGGEMSAGSTHGEMSAGSTCVGSHRRTGKKIILIASVSIAACLLLPCIYLLLWHRKRGKLYFLLCKKTSNSTERKIEALIMSHGSLAPRKYKYSEVTKITSSLNNKLGEGGYGAVFKGKLNDDRLVAVKFLHDSKGNGEEFVNEVMSIGRTSHVNIVSLFGFCLEGSKRALIYEYMPNGSLDKYIYSENPKSILGWDKLYKIAIGIARGLEYLHHSCNTRIVHFDIKPQNILLDQDFCPKIADFGLAKLCQTKESKLSMTGARGTVGFIAPEVHSRTFGVVSTKSDVYGYGMMLLEIVGGRKNAKSVAQKSSEKYFPHWIYDHFGQDDGLQACEVTHEDEGIAKKMSLIGLWCIQILPIHRPTITKVLEMFERGLDELAMPPKQNFSQILEDPAYILNATSTSNGIRKQAFSEGQKVKDITVVNSKILGRLPTL